MSEDSFERQIRAISMLEKPVLTIEELVTRPDDESITLTFDDGHGSALTHALPILLKYGLRATFFITTDWIRRRVDCLNWDGLGALGERGMDLQVHGHTHAYFSDASDEELETELTEPIRQFDKYLNIVPRHLSLPGGRFNSRVFDKAAAAGYCSLATSIPGINHLTAGIKVPLLKRYAVTQHTSQSYFEAMLSDERWFHHRQLMKYGAKVALKSVIGNAAYHRLWVSRMR